MTHPDSDGRMDLALSPREVDLLQIGLVRYMLHWKEHYEQDGGETHTGEELDQVLTEAGRLLWRLEQETAPPGVTIAPSKWAVPPAADADDEVALRR